MSPRIDPGRDRQGGEARDVAAFLTGRAASPLTRERAVAKLVRSLLDHADLTGLPPGARFELAPDEDARGEDAHADDTRRDDDPPRWAELAPADGGGEPIRVAVPACLASAIGTRLLGGLMGEASRSASPIDWRLAETTLEAFARRLQPAHAFVRWDAGGGAEGGSVHALALVADGTRHRLGLRIPISRATPPSAAKPDAARRTQAAQQRLELRAAATLDLATACLGDAMRLDVGSVLRLADGMDAIAVRVDGRKLLGGTLGHAGGRLCVRIAGRTAPARSFAALRVPPAPAPAVGPAQADDARSTSEPRSA